jgi:hypothetical protein
VAKVWSAHLPVVVVGVAGVLASIGMLAWLAFRKSELLD